MQYCFEQVLSKVLFFFFILIFGILSICAMIFGISLIIGELQNRKDNSNAV